MYFIDNKYKNNTKGGGPLFAYLFFAFGMLMGFTCLDMAKMAFSIPLLWGYKGHLFFQVDSFGALFILLSSFCLVSGVFFSIPLLSRSKNARLYAGLYALTSAGILGTELSGNLFSLLLFIALAFISYTGFFLLRLKSPLVREAAFKFLFLNAFSWLLLCSACGLLFIRYGIISFAGIAQIIRPDLGERVACVLAIAALSLQCGSAPLHFALFDAWAKSPVESFSMLAAFSLSAFYVLMRLCFSVFGSLAPHCFLYVTFLFLGGFSLILGFLMAFRQREFFPFLSCLWLSQLGIPLLGCGFALKALPHAGQVALFGYEALSGTLLCLLSQFLAGTGLFLLFGFLILSTGVHSFLQAGGLSSLMPFRGGLFAFSFACLVGVPPFSGFFPRLLLLESAVAWNPFFAALILVGFLGGIVLMVSAFQSTFLGGPICGSASPAGRYYLPWGMRGAFLVLLLPLLGLILFPGWTLQNLIDPAVKALIDQSSYIAVAASALGRL